MGEPKPARVFNWTPLEKAVPPSLLGAFMYMGEVGTIQQYKHRDTRRYFYIDSDCTRFYDLRHRGEDTGFVERDRGAALRYALEMCCCDDPGAPEGPPQQTFLRSLSESSLAELCSENETAGGAYGHFA